ncbi:transporter suffix domain-containing protein [Bacillus sp. FJAT-52991]|uniref:Transporter suffix domain-containing protein n=1 Tax=Bacillus kandeliae TaxID=3129297 RepID=A0ABZ2NBI2_9BACI
MKNGLFLPIFIQTSLLWEEDIMSESKKQTHPLFYKMGMVLIVGSAVFWIFPFIIPFLSFSTAMKATLITGSLICAEIVFWLGLLLVGKEAAMKFRSSKSIRKWKRRRE